MKLYKTTVVIWSEFNPDAYEDYDLVNLARDAIEGESYCSKQETVYTDTENDEDWDGTEFFNGDVDE